VRVAQRSLLTIVLLLGATAASVLLLVLALAPILLWSAQAPETMMPEQSAAKAKALLQQAITALAAKPISACATLNAQAAARCLAIRGT